VVDMQLIWVSLLALSTYDTCLTFDEEFRFLRHSRLSFMKVVYLIIRLTMFISLISGSSLPMRGDIEQCNVLGKLAELPSIIGLIAVEIMFIGRVYALWGCDKRILVPTLLTLVAHIASLAVIAVLPRTQMRPVTISGSSWIACLPPHRNKLCVIIIGTIFLLDLELLVLTLYRTMAYFRRQRLRLVEILIHHNVFYLACALAIAVVNMTLILTLYNNFMPSIVQGVFNSIVATRMHRRLWTTSESVIHGDFTDSSILTYSKDELCC